MVQDWIQFSGKNLPCLPCFPHRRHGMEINCMWAQTPDGFFWGTSESLEKETPDVWASLFKFSQIKCKDCDLYNKNFVVPLRVFGLLAQGIPSPGWKLSVLSLLQMAFRAILSSVIIQCRTNFLSGQDNTLKNKWIIHLVRQPYLMFKYLGNTSSHSKSR